MQWFLFSALTLLAGQQEEHPSSLHKIIERKDT